MNNKEIVDSEFLTYSFDHSKELDPLLSKIQRETHLQELSPIMISTPLQGQLLYFLTRMIRPKLALEIGTFTGYSAICMARGLEQNARLITVEYRKELEEKIKGYISEAELESKIELKIGEGLDIIESIDEPIDMVFIDADKPNYMNYYEAILPKLSTGGYILADNVLWFGRVFSGANDPSTLAIRAYNENVKQDPRVEQIILPMGDGLSIARKVV